MTAYITSLVSRLDNFNTVFPCEGKSEIFGHVEGAYNVLVSLDPDRVEPTILFSFQHETIGEIMAEKHLDYTEFLTEQFARYKDYILDKSFGRKSFMLSADDRALRESWRIESLKDFFSDLVEGDDEFWKQFNHGLEKIMWPFTKEMILNPNSQILQPLAEGPRR